ncbi:MAG TPA: 2Fe-2S iron-sulfur cluster-binding protein [Candidatus Limnocylindria bacterium]|nr:2Fe-2S iron-sulfur cluster-binding protein [Candidatus Limnocylindria bacterium]
MGGGMMEGMGEMMKGMMGGTRPKEFYPTLMDLPDLPPAKRLELEQQAGEHMRSGVALMNDSFAQILQAASSHNYSNMQTGTAALREGLARFESGLAARRALSEGKAPRDVALGWFKRDMNLLPVPDADAKHTRLGIFHWFAMIWLSGFFVVMIAMYFFKMRRTSALLQRIADGGLVDPAAAVTLNGPFASSEKTLARPNKSAATAAPTKTAATSPASGAPAGPTSNGWKGILRVNRIFDETPGVKTYRFTAMDGGPIPFTYLPGQYVSLFPVIDGKRTPRSYTMASSPTQRHYCELTIKREAKGRGVSKYLHDGVQEGELLEVSGPAGKFTFTGAEAKSVVLIGGGVGITPLMSYVRYLTDSGWPGEIYFLYACRHVSDFIFRSELERLCSRHPKLHLVVTVTRPNEEPWSGLTGRLTKELIAQSVPDVATRLVYVCGPDNMMRAAQAALLELQVPAAQIKTEAFDGPRIGAAEVGKRIPDTEAKSVGETEKAPRAGPAENPAGPAAKMPGEATGEGPSPFIGREDIITDAPVSQTVSVIFQKSGKTAPLAGATCILEAAEAAGVRIENECRVGTCGTCKIKLLSGAVTMEVEDSLGAEEKANGIILACQAKSTGNVVVEA